MMLGTAIVYNPRISGITFSAFLMPADLQNSSPARAARVQHAG